MMKINRQKLKEVLTSKEMSNLKKLDQKKNGSYLKLQYLTDCNDKISAKYKGLYNVSKITTISARKGIKYENLKSVIDERNNPNYIPSTKQAWYHHIDTMLCKHNIKEQYYVCLFPNKFGKPKTIYLLNGLPIKKDELIQKGIMQPSFWTQKENKPKMITLGLDKIIEVY